jgi:hypothetical protein
MEGMRGDDDEQPANNSAEKRVSINSSLNPGVKDAYRVI